MTAGVSMLPVEKVASIGERLAVLLAAGVTPTAAWIYLAADAAEHENDAAERELGGVLRAVAAEARAGGELSQAIVIAARRAMRGGRRSQRRDRHRLRESWASLAVVWATAIELGAPLADCMRRLAVAQRASGAIERDADTALAGPRSTSRLLLALPLIGLLFGYLLGFDPLRVLLTNPVGIASLVAASFLLLGGRLWTTVLMRAATPTDRLPGLLAELTAMALGSGVSTTRAQTVVATMVARYEIPAIPDAAAAADRVLALSRRAGVPAAELLRSEAEQQRLDAHTRAQRAAVVLSTRLLLPLGVCFLPAFMLIGVLPLLLSVLSSTTI